MTTAAGEWEGVGWVNWPIRYCANEYHAQQPNEFINSHHTLIYQ